MRVAKYPFRDDENAATKKESYLFMLTQDALTITSFAI